MLRWRLTILAAVVAFCACDDKKETEAPAQTPPDAAPPAKAAEAKAPEPEAKAPEPEAKAPETPEPLPASDPTDPATNREAWLAAAEAAKKDGTNDALVARVRGLLETGTPDAGAAPSVAAVLAVFLKDPPELPDDEVGSVRQALVEMLGGLGDATVVPTLVDALEGMPKDQPVAINRAAAQALGRLRAADAVEPLLAIAFRVPDVPTTTNIGERAKAALAAIGKPAVKPLVEALDHRNPEVERLATEHALQPQMVELAMASVLGAVGRAEAVDDLLAKMPMAGCDDAPDKGPATDEQRTTRAVVANALGRIADPRAVPSLCACANASGSPGDMFPIAEALGRIGGPEATKCLTRLMTRGKYAEDAVTSKDFVHQIRWEAARFAVLAASADDAKDLEAAFTKASKDKQVRKNLAPFEKGRDAIAECGKDSACWDAKLDDGAEHWFVREKAAVEVARAFPGSDEAATRIARAFSVNDPDARVTMAWLVAKVLGDGDQRCDACVLALQDQLDHDKGKLVATYQLSVLTARYTIAKIRPTPQ